jgi:hypothetical protein
VSCSLAAPAYQLDDEQSPAGGAGDVDAERLVCHRMFAVASTTILAKYSARARPGTSAMAPSGVRKWRKSTIQVYPRAALNYFGKQGEK